MTTFTVRTKHSFGESWYANKVVFSNGVDAFGYVRATMAIDAMGLCNHKLGSDYKLTNCRVEMCVDELSIPVEIMRLK